MLTFGLTSGLVQKCAVSRILKMQITTFIVMVMLDFGKDQDFRSPESGCV